MSKPKMLLFCGWGWAASSPLIYTLQRNLNYAHFGYTKYFKILSRPIWKEGELGYKHDRGTNKIYDLYVKGEYENYKSYQPATHRMNLRVDLQPLDDFPLDHFTKIVTGDLSISKYMDFWHALHDHVITKGYKCVGDGYMGRPIRKQYYLAGLRNYYESVIQYTNTLKSEFDVKVLCIARDPVRRAFSHYVHTCSKTNNGQNTTNKRRIRKNKPAIINLPIDLVINDYVHEINLIRKYIGDNVYCTVMEELWEGDGVTELSEFLEHPIKKSDLWKNLYAPDKGHLVEYDKDVPCQAYGQDLLELTPEIYWHYKNKFNHVYEKWKETFGSLPLHWGEPIEYKV